ncbi:glycosyltransferase family 2 protein [Planctomycetota bacterium]|nr:glycosyltransferase family 2 protein [Planctomycetota bacterium]
MNAAARPSAIISVVIPTYQRAELLEEAVTSAASQPIAPAEIVVEDDGSTDATADVVRRLHSELGPEIEVTYLSQVRMGGNAAGNARVRAASGGWIAFLDSDDLWVEDKLEKQVARVSLSPGSVACYCGLRGFSDEGQLPEEHRAFPEGDLSSSLLVRDRAAPMSCYLVRRSVLLDAGLFDQELQARQDWDMWIRVSTYGAIVRVQEPLTRFRHHDEQRAANDPSRELRGYRPIRIKYRDLLRALPLGARLSARSAYHRRVARARRHYEGHWLRVLSHGLAAWAVSLLERDNDFMLVGFLLPDWIRRPVRRAWSSLLGQRDGASRPTDDQIVADLECGRQHPGRRRGSPLHP